MNILILSCGTRNKIVQYFKKALRNEGKVYAADCSYLAPALYEADEYFIVPRIDDKLYIENILDICIKNNVAGVFSLIDPELSLLALNKEKFNNIGVSVIGSEYSVCEISMNKWSMYRWLVDHNYLCARSYIDRNIFFDDVNNGIIGYPVIVKPINGSASLSIFKAYDKQTIDYLFEHYDNLLIQEYLSGQEIGIDCYIDMISEDVISIFSKKKIVMRSGETDKSVSFKDEKLYNLIERFVKECGYLGQIDIDVFDIDGRYYISEVNPRFGGGYPHAYECGVDFPKMIINNLKNIKNIRDIGSYDENIYMMKYNEIKCVEVEDKK